MGTRIESIATATPHGRFSRGALHLSDVAARECLERAHSHAGKLDLLINVGLYKDHGLAEPALASIIQEDIGANLGHPPHPGTHGTFSFDVVDGAGGVLTAAYLIDGFLAGGAARCGMIVAADTDPEPRHSRGFVFPAAGGALLLVRGSDERGFERFLFRSFPEDAHLFEARTVWDPEGGLLHRGRHVLEVREAPAFAARCIEHGVVVARQLLAEAGLRPPDIAVLVASQHPRNFASELARALELDPACVPQVPAKLAGAYTAGPIAALETARAAPQRPGRTLFVTASAGITIGAALYRG